MADTAHNYPMAALGALALAGRRRAARRFGRFILGLLVLTPLALVFVPWQQNLPGIGRVIEYDPVNRPMMLQARTDGLVLRWHVREGQLVRAGDPIVDLADNDPLILERLREQITAAEQERDAAQRERAQYVNQAETAELARLAAIQLADDEIAASEQAVNVERQSVAVAEQKLILARVAEEMWTGLVEDQIGAGFELQKARQQLAIEAAGVAAAEAAVIGAEANLRAKRSARKRVEQADLVKVQEALAKREAADGYIAKAVGALPRLERDLERQMQQQLLAPVDGYVQNLEANGQGGGFVKQGATLATLVPATSQLAVELLVDGNDVTFIDVGRHVRLQFEGWPAVQWVGWPSAAVGTFGGKVAFVDRFDDGRGRFRVMVLPDERSYVEHDGAIVRWMRQALTFDSKHEPQDPLAWPDETWLRQGTRVKGWVVLERVSLGFEVWRQLNGFPPTVDRTGTSKGTNTGKKKEGP